MRVTRLHAIPNGEFAASEEVLRDFSRALDDHDLASQLGILRALLKMSVSERDTPVRGHARATARAVLTMSEGRLPAA